MSRVVLKNLETTLYNSLIISDKDNVLDFFQGLSRFLLCSWFYFFRAEFFLKYVGENEITNPKVIWLLYAVQYVLNQIEKESKKH